VYDVKKTVITVETSREADIQGKQGPY